MNDSQRTVLAVFAVAVVAMTLYPPFEVRGMNGYVATAGYAFLFSPPIRATLDVSTLVLQWIAALIAATVAFVLARRR